MQGLSSAGPLAPAKQRGFGAQDAGNEFPSGQKSGQHSHQPGKAKISAEDFILEALLFLFPLLAEFRSHLMQGRRRNLQTDPSKPLPKLTHQPCPREGVAAFKPFIHYNIPIFRALAALSAPAETGSSGKGVTVKELFDPQYVNVALTSNLPALCLPFIHIHIFPLAPLEYSTMISSLSFGENIYISYI